MVFEWPGLILKFVLPKYYTTNGIKRVKTKIENLKEINGEKFV